MQEELKALEEEADKLLQAQEIQSPAEAAPEDSTEEVRISGFEFFFFHVILRGHCCVYCCVFVFVFCYFWFPYIPSMSLQSSAMCKPVPVTSACTARTCVLCACVYSFFVSRCWLDSE